MKKKQSRKNSKKDKSRIEMNRGWCKGCGICIAFCPNEVLELDDEEKVIITNPDRCDLCGLCELRCPDIAIELK